MFCFLIVFDVSLFVMFMSLSVHMWAGVKAETWDAHKLIAKKLWQIFKRKLPYLLRQREWPIRRVITSACHGIGMFLMAEGLPLSKCHDKYWWLNETSSRQQANRSHLCCIVSKLSMPLIFSCLYKLFHRSSNGHSCKLPHFHWDTVGYLTTCVHSSLLFCLLWPFPFPHLCQVLK